MDRLVVSTISPTVHFCHNYFRTLRRDGFSSGSSSTEHAPGEPVGATSQVVLIQRIDALQDLFSIYPKAELIFRHSIRAANLDKGIGTDFQLKKERMLRLLYLLASYNDLTTHQFRSLCNAVLVVSDKRKTLEFLKSVAIATNKKVTHSEEVMWEDCDNYSTSMSDLRFLSYVKTIPAADLLHAAAVECEETAYDCLTTQLDSLVHETSVQIVSIQEEEYDKQVQLEAKNEEEKGRELKDCRIKLIRQVEDLSRERSRSYVTYSS